MISRDQLVQNAYKWIKYFHIPDHSHAPSPLQIVRSSWWIMPSMLQSVCSRASSAGGQMKGQKPLLRARQRQELEKMHAKQLQMRQRCGNQSPAASSHVTSLPTYHVSLTPCYSLCIGLLQECSLLCSVAVCIICSAGVSCLVRWCYAPANRQKLVVYNSRLTE